MPKIIPALLCLISLATFGAATNDAARPKGGHGQRASSGTNLFNLAVPAHDYDLKIGRAHV